MRDALDTTFEISKLGLVKYSPKRDSRFEKLRQELAPDTPGLRVLYPAPGGTSILGGRGGGGLDLTSSLEAKFGTRSGQVHQIRGKTWEVLLLQDAKVGRKSQFWGQI